VIHHQRLSKASCLAAADACQPTPTPNQGASIQHLLILASTPCFIMRECYCTRSSSKRMKTLHIIMCCHPRVQCCFCDSLLDTSFHESIALCVVTAGNPASPSCTCEPPLTVDVTGQCTTTWRPPHTTRQSCRRRQCAIAATPRIASVWVRDDAACWTISALHTWQLTLKSASGSQRARPQAVHCTLQLVSENKHACVLA
jgi:hypothetical protein